MVQVGSALDPSTQVASPPVDETDPFAGVSGMFGDMGPTPTAAGGELESLTSDIIAQVATASPETQPAIADSISGIFGVAVDQLMTLDLADPAAVASLQASLLQMMTLSIGASTSTTPSIEFALLSGIADTASAALTLATVDPTLGASAMEMVITQFGDLGDSFDAAAAGEADYVATAEAAFQDLSMLYESLLAMSAENGIEMPSLVEGLLPPPTDAPIDPLTDEPSPETDDPFAEPMDSTTDPLTGQPVPDTDDPFGDPSSDPTDPMPDPTTDPLTGEEASEVDDLLAELGLDPSNPNAVDPETGEPILDPMDSTTDPAIDPLTGQPVPDMNDPFGDPSLDPTDPMPDPTTDPLTGEETSEVDDLLADYGLDLNNPDAADPTVDPVTGEPILDPEDAAAGLSDESSTGGDPSAENQEALEARYIGLYESLMEKQIAFKEAIEPYKTDNQNAGKG